MEKLKYIFLNNYVRLYYLIIFNFSRVETVKTGVKTIFKHLIEQNNKYLVSNI